MKYVAAYFLVDALELRARRPAARRGLAETFTLGEPQQTCEHVLRGPLDKFFVPAQALRSRREFGGTGRTGDARRSDLMIGQ